jgi:hypothetical protein
LDTGVASPLKEFPRLQTYYEDVRSLPKLASYFAGPMYALHINNLMAGYGA